MKTRSQEFRDMLSNEYLNSTISIKELSEKYHTDAAYQLKKHGTPLKGRGIQKMIARTGCINYKWNASEISTEEQAYSIGFLMADGYNTGLQVGLTVKSDDLYILERIKNCFSDEIKIQREKNSVSFAISSIIICNNLKNLGIIEHKSHNEKNLPQLKPELIRHFIRGYFDGDGSIFVCNTKTNHYLKCNICSSTENILKQFQQILLENNIESAINIEKRIGKQYFINASGPSIATMDMFRLFIRRKNSIERFFHYLYDDATIYLPRKYKIFADNQNMFIKLK